MVKIQKLNIDRTKLRPLESGKNYFKSLIRSIIFQQLSGKAAAAIFTKFKMLFGKRFPKPQDVLNMSNEKLRGAGLSRTKIVYLKDLAAKFLDGTVGQKQFSKMTDEEIIEHLVQVKGIGPWTAHMFLIFTLNRPDVLPTGDLAIRKGFQKAFKLRTLPHHEKMVALARPHAGERTYLSLHLWQLLDGGGGEDW
ncbi:MAG TPA: DNA-3-methyladenine glycosylase 2 family protein [Candidatus Paceibacterota bacterium]|nr:DNA-3-methyladenine glycosylase 2 family protein [Candidatus Paceibacterota bacterium]